MSGSAWRFGECFGVLGGEVVDEGAGGVGGAVVDGDDAERLGVVLGEEGLEGSGDVGGFVAGGDDDAEGGSVERGVVVSGKKEVGDSGEADGGGDCLPKPCEGDDPCKECECELQGVGQMLWWFDGDLDGGGLCIVFRHSIAIGWWGTS